jgi:nicotinic acid mononucleotide adenylyltransferase
MDMSNVKAFFAFGRMNPPTEGHRRVVDLLRKEAQRTGSIARLYLSESHDGLRNPLTPQQKLAFAKKLFPDVDVRLSKTLFTAALEMADEGVDEGVMIVGEDRLAEFSKLLSAYAGTEVLGLKHAEVMVISREASDASATQARVAAESGDWETFRNLTPTDDEDLSLELYEAVRNGLGV